MHNVLFVMAGAHALAAPAAPSLYVVGCGVLGRATCRLWREAHRVQRARRLNAPS